MRRYGGRGLVYVEGYLPARAAQALARAGFGSAELHRPMDLAGHIDLLPGAGTTLVRVLEARPTRQTRQTLHSR